MGKLSTAYLVTFAIAACSIERVTFTPVQSPGDAAADPDGPADSPPPTDAPPTPRCDASKPFGAPTPVAELNTAAADSTALLTADELTLYFASSRPGGAGNLDIYIASRPARDAPWGAPSPLAGVNTPGHESRPVLTGDGLTLYAETNPISPSDWSISVATRTSTQASFGPLVLDPALNVGSTDVAPTVLPDGSKIYFVRLGDLFHATRMGNTWTPPAPVPGVGLHSPESEDYPLITADDRTLYFASRRTGGMGDHDIWVSTRPSPMAELGPPVPLVEVNSPGLEYPNSISSDGCELWLTRLVPATGYDLFVARRPL